MVDTGVAQKKTLYNVTGLDRQRHTHTHTQKKGMRPPHLVTVKPLPNNMSIRRNTRKLTENSNFPGDMEKVRQGEKTEGN